MAGARWSGRLIVLVGVVLIAAANASTAPVVASPTDFVRASGTRLEIGGVPWQLHGASTYGTTNPGASTSVDELVSLALDAHVNTLRIVNMFDERGLDPSAPTSETDWQRVDRLLARMRVVGLRAILDLSAFRNHLHESELQAQGENAIAAGEPIPGSCAGQSGDPLDRCVGVAWCLTNPATCTDPYDPAREPEWDAFLGWVANRINTQTGVRYADDPTIAIVAFAGEPAPPNSGEPLRPGTDELTDFYARTFDEWKTHDPNHLVTTGGLLHIDWEEVYGNPNGSGIDHEAIFALPNQDVLSIHNYFPAFPPTAAGDHKTPKIANAAELNDKPWITEEFGFLQAPTDGATTYTEADRAEWYRRVYEIQRRPSAGVPSAGAAFWNLGGEVAGASHDVNPQTPATWTMVQRYAPYAFGTSTSTPVSVRDDGTLSSRRSNVRRGDAAGWFVSADGMRVVFDTEDSGMVSVPGGLNGYPQVYVRDLAAHDTILVSEDRFGGSANSVALGATISADGTRIAFESDASDLTPTNGPGRDIFVRDLDDATTQLVSTSSDESPGGSANGASISADGRFVVFQSTAALVPEDTNGLLDIYLRDIDAGTTERISVATDGTEGNGHSSWGSVSDDGRFVAFKSLATTLVTDDLNGVADIFVRDRVAGTTVRVSVASDGTEADDHSHAPFISGGDLVAFGSEAQNLHQPVPSGTVNVFVHDMTTGTTSFVGPGNQPAISSDGEVVAVANGATLRLHRLNGGDSTTVSYGTYWGMNVTGRFVASSRESGVPTVRFDLDTPPDIDPPTFAGIGDPTPQPVDDGDAVAIEGAAVDDRGVTAVEAFLGADPGEGNATQVPLSGVDPVRFTAFVETASPGPQTVWLRARDDAGHWSDATAVPITVSGDGEEFVSQEATGGYLLTTDPDGSGATVADPVESRLGGQGSGTFSLWERAATPAVPGGLVAVPYSVTTSGTASPDLPLQAQVWLDASVLPPGTALDDVVAFADGQPLAPCASLDAARADPDPCTYYRVTQDDDVRIWLFASGGHTFTFAAPGGPSDQTPPTIAIDIPHEGAVYGRGQYVQPSFACADEDGGSGLATCESDAGPGPLDTSTPGSDSYTVTATDAAGNETVLTRTYVVANTDGADRDGDGLLDTWETSGIDADGDGTIDLALHQPPYDADPDHRDIFVEVDWMDCGRGGCRPGASDHGPVPGALQDVVDAFAAAPVTNPDGQPGIRLHVLPSEEVDEVLMIDFGGVGGGPFDGNFDVVKLGDPAIACDGAFGTPQERAAPDCEVQLQARALAFHYALFGRAYRASGSSGIAEISGNDLMVTVGSWSQAHIDANGGRRAVEAGTFMHELGHNLGLLHGGFESANCKPNYLSVMSYTFQFPSLDPTRPLDYSRQRLPSLYETFLDEQDGIGGPAGRYAVWGDGTHVAVGPANGPIDWNHDGDAADAGVFRNVNAIPGLCASTDDEEELGGNRDWTTLYYRFQTATSFVGGLHEVPSGEVTAEEATEAAMSVDFDGDGVPNANDTCPADADDLDADGIADACDPDNRVRIDIMPGSATNPIGLRSTGKTPVAILSTATFSAPARVDPTSLTFGRTGIDASVIQCERPKDVNGDGRRDLVCQFLTSQTGFRLGDTVGTLRGATIEGARFVGTDAVTIKR